MLRESKWLNIDSEELVPGDIVEVSAGEKVPADIRLLELKTAIIKVDQSAFTGETEPKNKYVESIL